VKKEEAISREQCRKGGKYYEQHRKYKSTGIQHERELIRAKHHRMYAIHKYTVDPQGLTQIHHEWIIGTAEYRGVALVDAKLHRRGIIEVIEVLEGEITLLIEEKQNMKEEREKEAVNAVNVTVKVSGVALEQLISVRGKREKSTGEITSIAELVREAIDCWYNGKVGEGI